MVGVNFATSFIRPDGQRNDDTPLDEMIRHMDYLIEHVGVDGVGPRLRFRRRDDPGRDRRCDRPASSRRRHAPARLRRSDPAQALLSRTGSTCWSGPGASKPATHTPGRELRRRAANRLAIPPTASMTSRLTALIAGVAPSRIWPYMVIGSGASEPTSIRVVLKFSNDMRSATRPAPTRAGRRNGSVIVRRTRARLAPRSKAASSSERSNLRRRAAMISVEMVRMNDSCPSTTSGRPGRSRSRSI